MLWDSINNTIASATEKAKAKIIAQVRKIYQCLPLILPAEIFNAHRRRAAAAMRIELRRMTVSLAPR